MTTTYMPVLPVRDGSVNITVSATSFMGRDTVTRTVHVKVSLFVCLSVSVFVCLPVSVCVTVCQSASVRLCVSESIRPPVIPCVRVCVCVWLQLASGGDEPAQLGVCR